jgi:hypothetical protein
MIILIGLLGAAGCASSETLRAEERTDQIDSLCTLDRPGKTAAGTTVSRFIEQLAEGEIGESMPAQFNLSGPYSGVTALEGKSAGASFWLSGTGTGGGIEISAVCNPAVVYTTTGVERLPVFVGGGKVALRDSSGREWSVESEPHTVTSPTCGSGHVVSTSIGSIFLVTGGRCRMNSDGTVSYGATIEDGTDGLVQVHQQPIEPLDQGSVSLAITVRECGTLPDDYCSFIQGPVA